MCNMLAFDAVGLTNLTMHNSRTEENICFLDLFVVINKLNFHQYLLIQKGNKSAPTVGNFVNF